MGNHTSVYWHHRRMPKLLPRLVFGSDGHGVPTVAITWLRRTLIVRLMAGNM